MLITQDDIQRIGDKDTLMHFLQEKLNLPIREEAKLEQIALPLPLPFLGLDDAVAEQIIDCHDFSGLPKDALGKRRPFLIRFRRESGYAEILRDVAENLHQKTTNPAALFFICANEHFQPFAFANFNDSKSEDWQTAILNIRAWTQENTHIYTSSEHELPTDFFPNVSINQPIVSTSHEVLLAKLENIGIPLGRDEDIYRGIALGYKKAFVIDQAAYEKLLAKDPKVANIMESFPDNPEKWRWKPRNVIYIPSSKDKRWPWSRKTRELEAEQVFKEAYPVISTRMKSYKKKLKAAKIQVEFYWEFPATPKYEKLKQPKIIFLGNDTSMRAAYDASCKFLYAAAVFIPTEDHSLLAILNSKLFNWFARKKFKAKDPKIKALAFKKENMKNAPIAPRTEEQKVELSRLVQRILDDPDSPKVPNIEREIDQLVYKLYDLTPAEIDLIEEESNQ
ncbi:hypothetical protein C6503_11620 [Candidatus Poribacteria bacterium]|nr:MAG: hypothetical protein C6503_11620 [Candidatus Poribacteria bacterium]